MAPGVGEGTLRLCAFSALSGEVASGHSSKRSDCLLAAVFPGVGGEGGLTGPLRQEWVWGEAVFLWALRGWGLAQ